MIRLAICDDDKNQVDLLLKYANDYFLANNLEVEIFTSTTSIEFKQIVSKQRFDMVFLDMEIDEKNGIDLAKDIRAVSKNAIIVFITGFDKYAKKAFDVKAFGYLSKPLTYTDFNIEMDEVVKELNERDFLKTNLYGKFVIQVKGAYKEFLYKDILWFQKIGKLIRMVYDGGEIEFRDTFNNIEKKLDDSIFVRCHEGYIVNMNRVFGYRNMKLIVRGKKYEIPVSRRRAKIVRDAIDHKICGKNL